MILASLAPVALAAALPGTAGAATTVWLCKPGIDDNPCKPGLGTTRLAPTGETLQVKQVKRAKRRRIDCFYVYPTVSDQPTPQANLEIDPELRSIALYQAARFSRDCRVFAPVYRQITIAGLFDPEVTEEMRETAYRDVLDAWRNYLRRHNRGRGVVLIGHSQGTFMLTRLAAEQIDPKRKRKVRRKLVSALLLGGNVTVGAGRVRGGDFKRIPACRSKRQLGCVVAFSTFDEAVPPDARFGRTSEPGREVLCTNPARLRGGAHGLSTIYPSTPFAPGTAIAAAIDLAVPKPPEVSTPWVQFRGAYRGRCTSANGANVLQVSGAPGAPELNPVPDSTWGLHLADASIALGQLTNLVRKQAKRLVNERR